jgi:hypothetical protein
MLCQVRSVFAILDQDVLSCYLTLCQVVRLTKVNKGQVRMSGLCRLCQVMSG